MKKPRPSGYTTVFYETVTDAAGHYELDGVAVGTYEIWAYKTSAISGYTSSFNVQESYVTTINIGLTDPYSPSATPGPTVPPSGTVMGQVTLNGNPMVSCLVRIINTADSSTLYEITTNTYGNYNFNSVPAGTYKIYAQVNSSTNKYSDSFTMTPNALWEVNIQL